MNVTREGIANFRKIVKEAQDLTAYVGFTKQAHYPDGTPVAYIAAIQEFGTLDRSGHTPPRPFMRPTLASHGAEWQSDIARGMQAALDGRIGYRNALEQVAQKAAGQIRQKISEVTSPALAESTIKAKGFSKPLVDTGQMLQSVTSVVVSGELP